jgi:hypothetical protein
MHTFRVTDLVAESSTTFNILSEMVCVLFVKCGFKTSDVLVLNSNYLDFLNSIIMRAPRRILL